MEINNKYNLRDKVYVGGEIGYINAIHVMEGGLIEYQIWTPGNNQYSNFSDWQIEEEPSTIGFKEA